LGQQVDRVTRVGWGNRDSNPKSGNSIRVNRVGNTEQKIGGSRRVVNTESQVVENLANTKSQVAENSAKKESRAMENSVNMENRVMQDLGGGGARNRKKENVLLQAKGHLHGGAQGVLPRHKNTDCK
jgi:hypothetical protein